MANVYHRVDHTLHSSSNISDPGVSRGLPIDVQWRPGFWIRLPFLGILALLMVLCCTAASIFIAILSNNEIVDSWKLKPSVLFSILSAVTSLLLSFALAKGLIISFWRTSLQGCALLGLHDNWYAGSSLWGAIRGGLRGNSTVNSLACILTLLSTARGPILQRASTPVPGILVPRSGNMTVNFATGLPDSYGGITSYSRASYAVVSSQTSNFTAIMNAYSTNAKISFDYPPCGDSCLAKTRGFGFRANCSQEVVKITETALGPAWTSNYFDVSVGFLQDNSSGNYGKPLQSVFALYATWLPKNYTQITINSTSSVKELNQKTCYVYGGIVAYDIALQNGTITMRYDDYSKDNFVQDLFLPGPWSRDGSNTVIGGFEYAADYLFTSTASVSGGNAVLTNTVKGSLANQFMVGIPGNDAYWLDPTDYMINQIRQIAFRASVQAAKDNATASNATQIIQYTGSSSETIYVTNFKLIAIAALLNILAVIAILPTYRGWWRLGRKFSLSPLEVARAFDAPLLRNTESNATWEQISERVGDRKVKYGEVHESKAGDRVQTTGLQFADATEARDPVASSK